MTYSLGMIPQQYGKWSINGGITAYFTRHEAIPGNRRESFVTGTIGLMVAY